MASQLHEAIVGLVLCHIVSGIILILIILASIHDLSVAVALAISIPIVVLAVLWCICYSGCGQNQQGEVPLQERNDSLRAMEEGFQGVTDKAHPRAYHSEPNVPRHTNHSEPNVSRPTQILPEERGGVACKLFTLEELERATGNFSKEHELGRGGFGIVYIGLLRDGQGVAVKRANNKRATNVEQYLNEVSVLSQVNHRNLVKLLGCCMEEEVPILVYELISNGNLEEHLQNSQPKSTAKLNWPCRLNIALQVAEALKYLHSQANPPIIHRDIKASNILLDDEFTAKVADFGISKLVDDGATSVSTVVKGTFGYLDPEYLVESRLTDKSDVYSYGILMLELLTSRKPIDRSLQPGEQNLAMRSVPLIKKKRASDIIDPNLKKEFSKQDYDTLQAVAEVAVACLVKERSSRPSMSEVVEMLQKIKGSNLKADSFFNRDTIDEGPPDEIFPIPESSYSDSGRLYVGR